MNRNKSSFLCLIAVICMVIMSCTTLGKPIEECFTARDNIAVFNAIGIVTYHVSKWEYRFCLSNSDRTDIVIDGTLTNMFNKTIVDVTFDDFTVKGTIEYVHHIIGKDIVFNLNDGQISGTVKVKDDSEIWDVNVCDKQLRGLNNTTRDGSVFTMKYGDEDFKGSFTDIFMGFSADVSIGGRHIYGQLKNGVRTTKYLLRSDDMSESDVMGYFVFDLLRLLRSLENNRR